MTTIVTMPSLRLHGWLIHCAHLLTNSRSGNKTEGTTALSPSRDLHQARAVLMTHRRNADIESAAPAVTSIPLTLIYINRLLRSGKISDQDYEMLKGLLRTDLSALAIIIPGHVNLIDTTCSRRSKAISRVFNTPELLEAILIHLPFLDLLLRVILTCKAFRNVIDHSPALQRILFRLPDLKALPARPFPLESTFGLFSACPGKPIFEVSIYYEGYHGLRILVKSSFFRDRCDIPAALRKTYVRQPPFKHIVIVDTQAAEPVSEIRRQRIRRDYHRDSGITFGDIFDFLKRVDSGSRPLDIVIHGNKGVPLACCDGPKTV